VELYLQRAGGERFSRAPLGACPSIANGFGDRIGDPTEGGVESGFS